MVKRDAIKPDVVVKVTKLMPGDGKPGPRFTGKLALHERLVVVGPPFSTGGMNLVKVRRKRTGEVVDFLYAFITNFCKVVDEHKDTPDPDTEGQKPPPET